MCIILGNIIEVILFSGYTFSRLNKCSDSALFVVYGGFWIAVLICERKAWSGLFCLHPFVVGPSCGALYFGLCALCWRMITAIGGVAFSVVLVVALGEGSVSMVICLRLSNEGSHREWKNTPFPTCASHSASQCARVIRSASASKKAR